MIRWITPRIGTAPWDDSEIGDGTQRVDVRDLVDRAGNPDALVLDKIRRAEEILASGHKVVICCDLGISRSNAIAAGVLSRTEEVPFGEAVARVVSAIGENRIKVDVIATVARALVGVDGPIGDLEDGVLLLGGSGFVGRRLALCLQERFRVLAPERARVDVSAGGLNLYLSSREHRARTIVHLARPSVVDNTGVGEAVTMLRNTLDVCRETGAGLVFLSGADVFSGHTGMAGPATEEVPRKPGSLVGDMNALCEELIDYHRQRDGLRALVVRSPVLYDDDGLRPSLVRKFVELALRGGDIVTHRYRGGPPLLDLVHVEDAVSAIAALLTRGETGAFHLGAGDTIATGDLARKIVELTASRSRVLATSLDADWGNVVLDGSKIAGRIGWQPRFRFATSLPNAIHRIRERKEAAP